jgi:adenosine deaminase CECR1
MGTTCSTNSGGQPGDEALLPPRVKTFSMPPSWITEKVTRQKMKAINGDQKFDSPEHYTQAVEALIASEQREGFDGDAVANASELEKTANAIVKAIKANDTSTIFDVQTTADGRQRRPADHFLGTVELINKTHLLRVAQEMPKGAHLHCHFNSCLPPSFLIERAKYVPTMFIRSTLPLVNEAAKESAEISFSVLSPDTPRVPNLFKPSYEPQTWMNYQDFIQAYPGDVEAVEKWLDSKMRLTENEVYSVSQTGKG